MKLCNDLKINRICVWLGALAVGLGLLPQGAPAQDDGPRIWGNFSLIHAMAEGEVRSLKLDGESMGEDRLDLGESTGNWPLRAGGHQLEIDCGGEEPLEATVVAEAGKTQHLVLFTDYQRDPDTGAIIPVPTVEELPLAPSEQFSLTLVSVARDEQVVITVNDEDIPVTHMKVREVPEWHGQELQVHWGEQHLGRYRFTEPGAFLFLIYQDREGKVRLLVQRVVG